MSIDIPSSKQEWLRAARASGLERVSIYDFESHDSASKMEKSQYLTLRSLWIPVAQFNPEDWGFRQLDTARNWLQTRPDWKQYLGQLSIGKPIVPVPELGSFSYVYYGLHQIERTRQIARDKVNFTPLAHRTRRHNAPILDPHESPSAGPAARRAAASGGMQKGPEYVVNDDELDTLMADSDDDEPVTPERQIRSPEPRQHSGTPYQASPGVVRELFPDVEDEEIVNSFLISLCAVLSFHTAKCDVVWSLRRKAFNFGDGQTLLFQARTDGHMFLSGTEEAKNPRSEVIVEVKPTGRRANERIIYQATAQMAAWILVEPDENQSLPIYRRVMILQERHSIRIIIAEYEADYLEYLCNKQASNGQISLMQMFEFGPWNVDNAEHMDELGVLILALALQHGQLA